MAEVAQRLTLLAADIERHNLFGGTRSAEAASDIRALLTAQAVVLDNVREEIRPEVEYALGLALPAPPHP